MDMDGFTGKLLEIFQEGRMLDNRKLDTLAAGYSIHDKVTTKELYELAIVRHVRALAQPGRSHKDVFDDIVAFYNHQVNLSHRTSQSVMLQQYSTPAPLAFLAGSFLIPKPTEGNETLYFEPSAGNGLLTIALPERQVWANEIDDFRSRNLSVQPFAKQLRQDASEPFGMLVKFDGIITNPPFGELGKKVLVDGFPITALDHLMAIRALDCMKDAGRASIIIGGHTEYDHRKRVKSGKNRIFLSYLYKHYHVQDAINISGDLYRRQGTGFDIRLILIDGRKANPGGFPPLFNGEKNVQDYETLYYRMYNTINNSNYVLRTEFERAKAISKLRVLELLKIA